MYYFGKILLLEGAYRSVGRKLRYTRANSRLKVQYQYGKLRYPMYGYCASTGIVQGTISVPAY